ncbi:Threonine-phosphate decarboxylase [Sulfitobacter sp. THAF37]|uniref:threonine-phosphate decarboxylase n=1 Tax=Sulfitobacter sp. THAF37 TaxID=2587855 RepID=UPI0012680D60|nr:threonine-phosphate decarboxylase [Sulfitobacter sp. THAF37]QFT57847.1 Threonine-phosphate decarboxylase [Sulfitobacter sp. THAF37]
MDKQGPEPAKRDHGGGIDAAARRFGGTRQSWLDLSTGINPLPYPINDLPIADWTDLPDENARQRLETAARAFWNVPDEAALLAVPGASAAIARIPMLAAPGHVRIPNPTYNEHAASFTAAGWQVGVTSGQACVLVNPNNPDGRHWQDTDPDGALRIIDESFCEVTPEATLINLAAHPGTLILKSFGKFWGLAGLRLGFVIGDPALVDRLSGMLGPWAVSGPALRIGARALADDAWTDETRRRLRHDATRLDRLMSDAGAAPLGGTSLFRLYDVGEAARWQVRLARHHIWSRIFPYSQSWLRLGLPAAGNWARLEQALT